MKLNPFKSSRFKKYLNIRWTITRITVVILSLFCGLIFLVTLAFKSQFNTVKKMMNEITNVDEPMSYAAQEMEINIIEMHVGALSYVINRNPVHLLKIKSDEQDFEIFLKNFKELCYTKAQKNNVELLSQKYEEFQKLIQNLIHTAGVKTTKINSLLTNYTKLDVLINRLNRLNLANRAGLNSRPTAQLQLVQQLEIKINSAAKNIYIYLKKSEQQYIDQISQEEEAVKKILSKYRAIKTSKTEKFWVHELHELFTESVNLTKEIIQLNENIEKTIVELENTGQVIDHILDDNIQNITTVHLKNEFDEVNMAISKATLISYALASVAFLFSLLIASIIVRLVARPIVKLRDLMLRVSKGELNVNIEDTSSNEIGDLTREFKHMLSDINRMNTEVETERSRIISSAKWASLGEMAGGIAHEINNPVGIIQGKSNLLLKHIKVGTFTEEMATSELKKIAAMTERITKIVSGLRSFSRSADNDPTMRSDINELIEHVMSLCAERFKQHDIKIEVNRAPNLFIFCRSVQIEQVLLNLLNNAHDAVAPLKEKWVRVDVKDLGQRLEISITDSGFGIPPAVVEKMMQPFFTTKEVGKGTGLGLSISVGIIESHNGKLWYDSSSPILVLLLNLILNLILNLR